MRKRILQREILYDNLFASRTFKYKIRPIVEEYRHRRTMRCRGQHPYGRRTSPSTSSTNDSLTSEEFPPFRAPSPKKERTATPSPINSLSHEQILRAIASKFTNTPTSAHSVRRNARSWWRTPTKKTHHLHHALVVIRLDISGRTVTPL